jgi:hypothetical protein
MGSAGIKIGDAVLEFTADSTSLDAAFDRIGPQAKAKLAPAADTVDSFGQKLSSTGRAAETASRSFLPLQNQIGLLDNAMRGTASRGLADLIKGLDRFPALLNALPFAAAAAGIVLVGEVALEGVEKLEKYLEKQDKIKHAWVEYAETVSSTTQGINSNIDSQEQKIIEMTQGPVAALDYALQHLETTAFQTFRSISSDVESATKAMKEQGSAFNVFGDAAKDLDKFRDHLFEVMKAAKDANPSDLFASYNAGVGAVSAKEQELTKLIQQRTAASGRDASAAIDGLKAELKVLTDIQGTLKQGIKLDEDRQKSTAVDEANQKAQLAADQAKRNLDGQIAKIEQWKASVHAAYDSGRADAATWQVTQVQAADAVTAAQEQYLARLVTIWNQAGNVIKTQAAIQDLANAKVKDSAKDLDTLTDAIQKHNQAAIQMRKSWVDLLSANVAKEWQQDVSAAHELIQAEQRLAAIQTQLAEAQLSAPYEMQEHKIRQLAADRVITEQQMAAQLAALYRKEEADAERPLNALLANQKRVQSEMQAALDQARDNPYFSNAQLKNLEKNLDEAEADVAKTELQIQNLQNRTEQKIAKSTDDIGKDFRKLGPVLRSFEQTLQDTGSKSQAMGTAMGEAITSVTAAYAQGAITIKQAVGGIVAAELQGIASLVDAKGTAQLAEAFGAWPDVASMAHHFASATLWFSLGGIVSAAASKVGGIGQGSGTGESAGGGIAGSPISTSPAGQTQPNPVQRVNVQGSIIPRVVAGSPAGNRASSDLHIHLNLNSKGFVTGSPDQVGRAIAKQVSKVVKNGTATLHSSTTGRVIRKSP